jgi:hypothetical protein
MEVNLIYPAVLVNLITILLFMNSKLHDRYLLFIMIIGQLILISGESDKHLEKIQISHILFTLTIIIGSVYFHEKNNLYLIGILILIRFITRYIYEECLFYLSNQKFEFEFEDNFKFINWDIVFFLSLILISFRLFKDKIMK